ncbi:MAG: hypothetical protein KKA62_02055 [Nanoarchaeota archaeon]|nr:hypothetical protein [Nanoarchaeota archaeon]MBU1644092.1 hypothetical protein [Nanoarchaeota archaeon]MBU1976718.1 hypothetical protein [Nanoarchaeota archaeon]
MRSTKDLGESPVGYVRVEREGELVRAGSRIERITRNGEAVLVGLDTEQTCSWVRQFRGTIRYSPLQGTKEISNKVSKIKGQYIVMSPANTYASGVHALRKACKENKNSPHPQYVLDDGRGIYRPLTLGEIISARLQDSSLFEFLLESCTGIAYKKKSTKFKIIPLCKELITIYERFDRPYLGINYDQLICEEFDKHKIGYNRWQNRAEAKKDPLWLAAVGDKDLLSDYVDEVFDRLNYLGKEKGMALYVKKRFTVDDELKVLSIGNLDYNSIASGNGNLNNNSTFLRVARCLP